MRWLPRGQAPLRWAVRRLAGRGTPAEQVAAWRVLRESEHAAVLAAFEETADRAHGHDGLAVQRLRRNLGRAVGDDRLEVVVAEALRTAHRAWAEALLTHAGETRVEGPEPARGTVLAVPHQAGADRAALALAARLGPLIDLTEPIRPRRLTEGLGRERLDRGVDKRPERLEDLARLELERELAAGAVVLVGGDRDDDLATVEVGLLGEAADLPVRPATLALTTGAALVPLTLRYDGPMLVLRLHEPVPPGVPQEMTQALADAYTASIRADPGGWHLDRHVFTLDRQARM